MATVTKTIGTASRDYSTITLWEADLDDDIPYDSGDDAVGDVFNDAAFDELPNLAKGGTLGLNSTTLQAASGEEHDGTAGTGARIVPTSDGDVIDILITYKFFIKHLEIDGSSIEAKKALDFPNVSSDANRPEIHRFLIHDIDNGTNVGTWAVDFRAAGDMLNTIIYDILNEKASTSIGSRALGVFVDSSARILNLQNCTIHKVTQNNGTVSCGAVAYDIDLGDTSNYTVQNCIGTDTGGTTTAFKDDFQIAASANEDHNLSSDTTAAGTGSLTSKTSANQFVSTTDGSEDLHLKSGADAIDAGTDLGTTPTGVEIDIDLRDRDAEGDTWDMGADEFVAVAVADKVPINRINQRRDNYSQRGSFGKAQEQLAA